MIDLDDAAVRQHYSQTKHVFAHRSVANGVRPRRACRSHTAECCFAARIYRKEQIRGRSEMLIQLKLGYSCLDLRIHIIVIDRQDTI